MEMEDHSHTNQYGLDLRQLIGGRPTTSPSRFPPLIPHQPPELVPGHTSLGLPSHQHYDLMMLMPRSGMHLHDFPGDSTARGATYTPNNANSSAVAAASSSPGLANAALIGSSSSGMVEVEGGCFGGGDISGTGRWPRQETLTLLEIRSSLDSKFKEANQKGHLWEEVSRIMADEHGYQRSGKKCREKFENLYKYYKKTKEGKAGRQDGKHYRFFRQLEALYGETSNNNPSSSAQELTHFVGFNPAINKLNCDNTGLSLSNSDEFDTTSEEEDQSTATLGEKAARRKRGGGSGRSWKTKVKEFLDAQMRKVMERQEAWLGKLTCTLEEKEKERLEKEEEWRKREAERVDREHRFWAKEREWIEARDAALMEALQKLTGRDHHQLVNASSSSPEGATGARRHQEETREGGNKKRKENSRISVHFQGNESMYHPGGDGGGDGGGFRDINNEQCGDNNNNNNNNNNNVASNSCFRFLMSGNIVEGEDLWENYGLKPSRGGEHGSQ